MSASPEPSPAVSESETGSPLLVYKPPTLPKLLRTAAINLFLPFVNGLMLGFGELFAHEIAFRWGWGGTRVFPSSRLAAPGVEVRELEGRRGRKKGEGDRELLMGEFTGLE